MNGKPIKLDLMTVQDLSQKAVYTCDLINNKKDR